MIAPGLAAQSVVFVSTEQEVLGAADTSRTPGLESAARSFATTEDVGSVDQSILRCSCLHGGRHSPTTPGRL